VTTVEIASRLANLRERIDAVTKQAGEGAYHQDEAALLTAEIHMNILLRIGETADAMERVVLKLEQLDKTILTAIGIKFR
jgi:hypothetical protein